MDVLFLSRLQFAAATFFHFLFVPLTLGLSVLIALMETRFVTTGDEEWRRMAKFWGKLFLVNFAVGVVTGLTLEFQFGTNWSRYSTYVGDIFGSLLAIEATLAFFLESTFVAVWAFGWRRLSPKTHVVSIWLVVLASNLSALWILVANAWMQHPVGYVLKNGRAELESFFDVVLQGFAWHEFAHTVCGAYVLSGFFVMGVSAWHILRRQHLSFFLKSFRLALGFALLFAVVEVIQGHVHASHMAQVQPTKLAAMECHWETEQPAPLYLFIVPDEQNERNSLQLVRFPKALSLLAYHSTGSRVQGLKDFPREDRPPVFLSFVSFRLMVGLGFLFVLLAGIGWLRRNRLEQSPLYLRFMLYALPLPYIACEAGWMLAEVGRQPWIVYGLMRTKDAVSPISPRQVLFSGVAMTLLYTLIGLAAGYLLFTFARQGPEPAPQRSARKGGGR